ncbi:MAG: hypothetical protein ATN33_00100 [Epulopiscium sp. Nele67-Bin001]|nr:MAG: hypothetical protein ATN33_00100 [Epulopiscium sp. Nele67-Bin001]
MVQDFEINFFGLRAHRLVIHVLISNSENSRKKNEFSFEGNNKNLHTLICKGLKQEVVGVEALGEGVDDINLFQNQD